MTNKEIISLLTPVRHVLHSRFLSDVIILASALDAFPNYSDIKKKFPSQAVAFYEELRNV